MNKKMAGVSAVVASVLAAGYMVYRQDTQVATPQATAAAPITAPVITQPVSAVIIPRPRSPRPSTLDPTLFTDPETQQAYQVAHDKPALLEKMACYCGCMRSIENHTSNLDCFADNHGVGCAMCRRIALDAAALQEKGMSTEGIKKEIDARYAR